ncbi:S8 family serine peptidase [Pontibacter ramchanderi]|uniref:Putative secreted protein (Por secretion system target) n=1 Tax=Pontibacter ramchanderi TaxID=1179743 RepID=A0A2N3UCF1_9BACT|nr:S8 family serine peptidase [Pontibacter ramchanderi]PKV67012.1 putative secreted protein (Por secretion system target) [Pontibacter ramchanderi]
MRGLSLWLMAAALATTSVSFAQQGGSVPVRANVKELGRIAAAEDKDYRARRAEAIALARQNGWEIEKTYPDGTHLSLQRIDALGMPVYYITYNTTAAITTRTDQLWAGGKLGLNLSGASSSVTDKMGIWDGGLIRESHVELRGRVEHKDKASKLNEHATHVAGTLIASGQSSMAKGMAYGVKKLLAYDFNNNAAEMAEAAQTNMLVSNHSYGTIAGWRYNSERKGTDEDPYWEWWGTPQVSETEDYKFGLYDETSVSWDRIAYNAPYFLIVKSGGNNRQEQGPAVGKPYMQRNTNGNFTLVAKRPDNISNNDSYDAIATYGNAKNILTVGAVNNIPGGYNQPSDVRVTGFSSFGPTDDGRIKPDLVGSGEKVLSTTSTNDKSYKVLSGTSMAAPNISGSLLLLQEHYANLRNGQVMRAATLKGLAIHTADEAGDAPGPDYKHGWGLLNASRAATMISNAKGTHLMEERSLEQGKTYTFEVVASGDGPLVATISWTDPEGATHPTASALNNRSPRLVNDLDVRITNRGNTIMPWVLNPNAPDQPATRGDNVVDNVEQVLIPSPIPGETYTITVSHKRTLQKGPQAYSLLVSGAGGTAYCASTPTSEAGSRINSLTFDGITTSFEGCATYRLQNEMRLTFEPGQTKTVSFELGTCGANASKAAKVYVDWNGNGSFADAGEEAATSGVITGVGVFNASISAPSFLEPGSITRLRVVLAETANPASIKPCGTYTRGETQDYIIQVARPSSDIVLQQVAPVGAALCAGTTQQFMVTLRNNGLRDQKAIPVTLEVYRNGVKVATLTQVYSQTLRSFETDELLLTADFQTEAGATYELVAAAGNTTDAVPENNTLRRSFGVGGNTAAPQAVATRCGNEPSYTLTGSGEGTIFWYNTASGGTPIAAGNTASVSSNGLSGSLYASLNDFSATIGPATKKFATGGGYNQFTPDVIVETKAPMLLESARLYIGNPGKITFTAYNSDGSPVATRTLKVEATRSTPAPGVQEDDPNDQGAIYYLGLELPEAGTYNIAISYDSPGGATIYRNNAGVTGYPFGVPNVFTITGTTANPGPLGYYYYFYDLKVRALGCVSPRVAVPVENGAPIPTPLITRQGLNLQSSVADGNQWYLNNQPIPGATGRTYTPTVSGDYSVQAQWQGCVSSRSQTYTFAYQADGRELKQELVASPNPSNGVFKVQFETAQQEDLYLRVTDMLGHEIYSRQVKNFNGFYEGNIDLSGRGSGIYLLRVEFGDQHYTQKLVLQR